LPAVNPNARSLAPLNVTPETDVLLESLKAVMRVSGEKPAGRLAPKFRLFSLQLALPDSRSSAMALCDG
jgi:hypothetical protein